jgi:hypothetical protein
VSVFLPTLVCVQHWLVGLRRGSPRVRADGQPEERTLA